MFVRNYSTTFFQQKSLVVQVFKQYSLNLFSLNFKNVFKFHCNINVMFIERQKMHSKYLVLRPANEKRKKFPIIKHCCIQNL